MAIAALPGISAWCLCIALNGVPRQYAWQCGSGHVLKFLLHVYVQVCHGDMNDIIYGNEGASMGQYRCPRGPIWIHTRAHLGHVSGL